MSRPSSRASRSSRHSKTASVSSNPGRAYRDHSSDEGLARPAPRRADTRDLDTDSQGSDDDAEGRALASPGLAKRDSFIASKTSSSRKAKTETDSESETESDTEDEKAQDLEKGKTKKVSLRPGMYSCDVADPGHVTPTATPSLEHEVHRFGPRPLSI